MWSQLANAMIGVWLMAAPAVLSYGDPAQMNDRIVGPIAGTIAFVAIWEATRPLRWANLPLGLWLLAAPWVLGDYGRSAIVNSSLAGLLLLAGATVPTRVEHRFGGGWSAIWSRKKAEENQ